MEKGKANTGIEVAVVAAGSQVALATSLGVTQQAVSNWIRQGWVPLGRACEIELRFKVPRYQLINPLIVSTLIPSGSELK